MPELEVRSLTKRYGKKVAVDDLSFEVEAGRVTGFLGPNGAGKTTTMRALLGLLRPTSGEALVEGRPPMAMAEPLHAIGAALEATAFHPGRSGRNHLRTLAAAGGIPRSRVEEVLEMVELSGAADRRVKGYSLGMRQRLALAAALLGEPRILILDEPANGLDPQGMRWLRDLLRAQAAEGRTVLVSSHLLSEVAQTVDELVMIRNGKLVAQTSLAEFTAGSEGGSQVRVRASDISSLGEALGELEVSLVSGGDGALLVGGHRGRQDRRNRPAAGNRDPRTGAPAPEPRGALHRADGRGGVDLMNQLRSEWLKLWTTRTTWVMLGIALLGEALFAGLYVGLTSIEEIEGPVADPEGLEAVATGVGLMLVMLLVLGVLIATTEFRHGTASSTFLASRRSAGRRCSPSSASHSRSGWSPGSPTSSSTAASRCRSSPIAAAICLPQAT